MTEVTYGRLDAVLRALGFSVRVDRGDELTGEARVYRHGSGALIPLPVFPDGTAVLPRHLVAVRTTLANFGITDPLDFDAEVHKAG